jgi:Topoisomerase 6 subunit A/Spo11, Toprim domain
MTNHQGRSLADDIIDGVRFVTKAWAKQRKAEERHESQRAIRLDRLIRSRRVTIKDAAWEVMREAYMVASANDSLPANARQIMYAARPKIQERTGKQLDDQYFCQTLLPDYMEENEEETAHWDVAYDDRGHFTEPHTGRMFGLGTLKVRQYLRDIKDISFQEPGLQPGSVVTHGPNGCYGAILFAEKEGFGPLFEAVHLGERYDLAIMSTKGLSVTAARKLIDDLCGGHDIPLLVLHDFDKSGFSILGTLQRATRRYEFENDIEVIDLGLRLPDVNKLGLEAEQAFDKGSADTRKWNLLENGASSAEIEFLLHQRVELNALPSDRLVEFIERKLQQHGIAKVVPDQNQLEQTYRLFARSKQVQEVVATALASTPTGEISVPDDLEGRVREYLEQHPDARWDAAFPGMFSREANDG